MSGSWSFRSEIFVTLSKIIGTGNIDDTDDKTEQVKSLLRTRARKHAPRCQTRRRRKLVHGYCKVHRHKCVVTKRNESLFFGGKYVAVLAKIHHILLKSAARTNLSRPGVTFDDAVSWCSRMGLDGIYSGHQDV